MKIVVLFVFAVIVATSASRGRILGPASELEAPYQGVTTTRTTSERLGDILKNRYVRGPISVVVDTEPTSLAKTKRFWEDTLAGVNDERLDMIIMPYSTSGSGAVMRTKGVPRFRQVLGSLKETPVPPHSDGAMFGGVAFYSVLRASQQVPYDGGIILMTGRSAVDESVAQLAAAELIKKRCKLHVVWFGAASTGGRPGYELLYRELAQRSGGDFIIADPIEEEPVTEELPTSITKMPNREPLTTIIPTEVQEVTLAVRRGVSGVVEIPLQVDSTVITLHVNIGGSVQSALLRTPQGVVIDLLSDDKFLLRPTESANIADGVDVRLDTSATTPGMWTLTTNGDSKYDVTVKAVSELSFTAAAEVRAQNATESGAAGQGMLRLTMVGVGNIDQVTLLDDSGVELHKLSYQRRDDSVEDLNNQVTTNIDLPEGVKLPDTVYVRLSGVDPKGAEFSRIAPVTLERQQLPPTTTIGQLPGTSIEMSANTTLNIPPNYWGQLVFEVTNHRNTPITFQFQAKDDRGYIRSLAPRQVTIGPHLTFDVSVTIIAPADTSYGTTDNIDFVATSPFEFMRKIAQVTIGDRVHDNERPQVTHWIRTNCRGYIAPDVCRTRVWNAEFRIEDRHSGLLRVVSQPTGIRFNTDFIAGTKNPVTAYYSNTCCYNKVAITVIDASGNFNKYEIDGDDTYWGLNPGEIAAVTLGVILFVVLIILIVLAICLCKGRTVRSHELPVHPVRSTRH